MEQHVQYGTAFTIYKVRLRRGPVEVPSKVATDPAFVSCTQDICQSL